MLEGIDVTWLGHSTFLFETPAGKRLLVDPWLKDNPRCPPEFHQVRTDAIAITHGHGDHTADVVEAAGRCTGPVIGAYELIRWLATQGIAAGDMIGMNKGGRVHLEALGLSVAMTDARHSSSTIGEDGVPIYLGEAAGLVIAVDGGPTIYHAGDTCLFGDMALIAELYQPDVAILPIGDRFTMDPRQAAIACRLLGCRAVIPCHWGTYGFLTGTPEQLDRELERQGLTTRVLVLTPGESTRRQAA